MEQGGENPISIESKSVNENSLSATSLRPTLKASDLRSTMASLNSNDTPLTQTGIPQAEHEGDSDTIDKQPEASPALNEAKEAAADLHVTLPPVDSSEMEVNDDSLNRDSGVTGTSGAADSSHDKSVPEAAGHHGASDSNHVPARPRMRASVLGASKVSLNKVGGEAILAEANGSTKPETDKAEASGNRSASDSNTAISRPKMRASELGVSKSSLNKVKGDSSPSVGVESTDVQPEAAAPEAAGHCPDSGATRPKMRMRSSELGVSKASLNKVKGDSSPFVDAELSDVQPETVEKGEAAHHNANDSTSGPHRPRMRASELGAKKSSLQSVGAEGERKPGTGNADNVLSQVVSPALRMLVEQPEVNINREPVADDRPRAVVFGHAHSASQQQPRMRASELGTKRASLKKVDRHSKDPEDWESSKRKSRTESQSKDEPSIIPPALRLFDEPDPLSNMILVAEGTELHVHKEVLGSWSPVFMAMFSSSFVETQQNRVDMYGKTVEEIRLLLNCIYPPNILSVNSENVMTLLPLVEEYGITALKEKCEDIIAAYEPSLDVVLIAHQFNMPQLMERTIEACACLPLNAIDHKKNSELTDHIPETVLLDIYRTKIENQIEQIRQFKKLRERVTTTKQRLRKFGKAANSYPCEKHREFKEECVLCLQKFRETTYAEIDKIFDI